MSVEYSGTMGRQLGIALVLVIFFVGVFFASYFFSAGQQNKPGKMLATRENTSDSQLNSNVELPQPNETPAETGLAVPSAILDMTGQNTNKIRVFALTPSATASLTPKQQAINRIAYQPNSFWQTYTGDAFGFSIQYPPNYKLNDPAPPGITGASFLSCNTFDPTKGQICLSGFSVSKDAYDGGSRRKWYEKKNGAPYRPYYEEFMVSGSNTLLIMDGNSAGSTGSVVLIPKGDNMYVLRFPFGWDPETNNTSNVSFIKQVLSTFTFL